MIVSAAAAVLTNIGKSHDDAGQIAAAEAADTELDGLATLLRYGNLSLEDAVKLYQQYVVKIPFVDGVEPTGTGAGAVAPRTAEGNGLVPETQAMPVAPPPRRAGDGGRPSGSPAS